MHSRGEGPSIRNLLQNPQTSPKVICSNWLLIKGLIVRVWYIQDSSFLKLDEELGVTHESTILRLSNSRANKKMACLNVCTHTQVKQQFWQELDSTCEQLSSCRAK
jgi:hypothetical protein